MTKDQSVDGSEIMRLARRVSEALQNFGVVINPDKIGLDAIEKLVNAFGATVHISFVALDPAPDVSTVATDIALPALPDGWYLSEVIYLVDGLYKAVFHRRGHFGGTLSWTGTGPTLQDAWADAIKKVKS